VISVVSENHVHAGAIRKSSPVIVGSLVVMVTALTFSILGSNKHDVKTLVAAILYISGGMIKRRCALSLFYHHRHHHSLSSSSASFLFG